MKPTIPSIAALDLRDARPRGATTVTLYLTNARPSFIASPQADRATIAVPNGSELLSVRGEPLLFVPGGIRTRHAWTARDVWLAARLDERGFSRVIQPKRRKARSSSKRHYTHSAEYLARKARKDAHRLAVIRRLRREGHSLEAVGEKLGLTRQRVWQICRDDQALRQSVSV